DGVQQRSGTVGPGGLLLQAGEALGVEGVDGIADGWGGAAEVAGDQGRAVAGGAGQQDLTAAQSESGGRAQARPQLLLLRSRQGTYKGSNGSHTSFKASQRDYTRTSVVIPLGS